VPTEQTVTKPWNSFNVANSSMPQPWAPWYDGAPMLGYGAVDHTGGMDGAHLPTNSGAGSVPCASMPWAVPDILAATPHQLLTHTVPPTCVGPASARECELNQEVDALVNTVQQMLGGELSQDGEDTLREIIMVYGDKVALRALRVVLEAGAPRVTGTALWTAAAHASTAVASGEVSATDALPWAIVPERITVGLENRTTVVVSNIPHTTSCDTLIQLLNLCGLDSRRSFDFLHVTTSIANQGEACRVAYVNFLTPADVFVFYKAMSQYLWRGLLGQAPTMYFSHLQGRAQLTNRFFGTALPR
jgi:hypothetical protein